MAKLPATSTSSKVLLTGIDIVRGATTNSNGLPLNLLDVSPFQMISLDEKDESWVRWNADFHESIGYQHVKKYGRKQIKNRWLAAGILDYTDYLLSPEYNNFSDLVGIIRPHESDEHQSPLEQFYPLIPNVMEVLKGEFMKRDTKVVIKAVDEFSKSEALQDKEDKLQQILLQKQLQDKAAALARMGILPNSQDPKDQQQYQSEMQAAQQVAQVEAKFRSYRSVAEQWAQHVHNINTEALSLDEKETRGFIESLTNSREFYHIDLKEDRFDVEPLDSAYCFYHMSPKIEYVSKGDYFGWFDWMTVGDVINNLNSELDAVQLEGLKTILSTNTGAMVVPDMWKAFPSMYYDTTKPYPLGRTDAALNDAILERNLKETYVTNSTNERPASEILSKQTDIFGQPHMFRVMRLYWRSQRKIGFLTKIDRTGQIIFADWVDENFEVTIKPVYDNSLVKGNTKYNLIYGEHVDWTYSNEWRRVVKINSNMSHTFWQTNNLGFNPIYLDGKPVKFQFRGDDDPFESLPPIEGRVYKYWGVRPVSLIDRLKPWQIGYNICNNKIPKILSMDPGIVLAINKGMIPRNYSGNEAGDPKTEYMDDMRDRKVIEYEVSRETLELPNQAALPSRVDLSMIEEASKYFTLGKAMKEEGLSAVGITMQRLGETKASETLGGNQTAINFSETQTEPYFNQHSNELMPRVIAREIEAAQYYASTKETSRVYYMNDQEENVFLEIEGTKMLPRHYHIYPTNKPRTKQMMQELKKLLMDDNTMGATLLEKAQGIVADSVPEYLRLLRESEERREQGEQQKSEQDMQQQQADRDAAMQLLKEKQAFEADQNDKNRATTIESAQIRALGGVQTDADANGELDAEQNLATLQQKTDQANNVHSIEQQRLDLNRQELSQGSALKQKELSSKEKIAKMNLEASKAKAAKTPKKK